VLPFDSAKKKVSRRKAWKPFHSLVPGEGIEPS
jgi:hypothetical protein